MPTINKPKKKRDYSYSKNRDKRQSVYNTTRWVNMRKAKLISNPKCEICEIEGKVTLAEDVHHLISFVEYEDDEALAYAFDFNNLCSVCKKCHARCHTGDLQGTKSLDEIKHILSKHTEKSLL